MTVESQQAAASSRERWKRVTRDVLVAFGAGCFASTVAVKQMVDRNSPHDDMIGLAYVALVFVYLVGGVFVLLLLALGLARRLQTAALVVIAVVDLALGVFWGWWALPDDPGCVTGCSSGGHGVMPVVSAVLLCVAAVVHLGSAALFGYRAVRPAA